MEAFEVFDLRRPLREKVSLDWENLYTTTTTTTTDGRAPITRIQSDFTEKKQKDNKTVNVANF